MDLQPVRVVVLHPQLSIPEQNRKMALLALLLPVVAGARVVRVITPVLALRVAMVASPEVAGVAVAVVPLLVAPVVLVLQAAW